MSLTELSATIACVESVIFVCFDEMLHGFVGIQHSPWESEIGPELLGCPTALRTTN